MQYIVDWADLDNPNIIHEKPAKSYLSACAMARRTSRKLGDAAMVYVVALDKGKPCGDVAYYRGYRSHSEGRVHDTG